MNSPSSTSNQESAGRVIKPKAFVVSRVISEQALILDTACDEIRQLNEVGSFIWSLILKSTYTRDDMLSAVIRRFEVSSEIASTDLDHFINELSDAGLVVYVD